MPQPTPEPANKLILTLEWENRKVFRMRAKNSEENKVLIEVEEDGQIALGWATIQQYCQLYFQSQMDKIGAEMKKL